jgi:hypothetical protein
MSKQRKTKQYREPVRRSDGLWAISDLYCASFLHARGNEAVATDATSEPGRSVFLITAGPHFDDDFQAWKSNTTIRVRDFIQALYALKRLIHTGYTLEKHTLMGMLGSVEEQSLPCTSRKKVRKRTTNEERAASDDCKKSNDLSTSLPPASADSGLLDDLATITGGKQ